MLSSIFERFIEASPVTVMLRATLERNLKRFASSPKARKKSQPKRKREPNRPRVSTARLLADKQRSRKHSWLNQQTSNLVETPLPQALQT